MQAQSSADRITTSLSLSHQRKNKQRNKNSAQILPYMKLTQTIGPTLKKESEVAQSCPTLCDPMDYVASVYVILQARILEWAVISFSRGSSQPRDWTWVSHIAGRRFILWATRTNLRRVETKRKKEFNLEAWEKDTSNTIS